MNDFNTRTLRDAADHEKWRCLREELRDPHEERPVLGTPRHRTRRWELDPADPAYTDPPEEL